MHDDALKGLEASLAQYREELAYYLEMQAKLGGSANTPFEVSQKLHQLRALIQQAAQELQRLQGPEA